MKIAIVGIIIGCVGIIITIIVGLSRKNKFSQKQKDTEYSDQTMEINKKDK